MFPRPPMKVTMRLAAALFLLLLFWTTGCDERAALPPAGDQAVVVDVIDGDTIDVRLNGRVERVRYVGIDTPERGDPFYDEATAANRDLVAGRTVILVRDVSETDRFGRLLRYVYLEDGTLVNGELLRQGWALLFTLPPDVGLADDFLALQEAARADGRGLWAGAAEAAEGERVIIADIFYDGFVELVESDEYALLENVSDRPVDLAGWRLAAGSNSQSFTFPAYTMQPGATCRVYTNEIHPESCGFSFGLDEAIWRNGGECGTLFDAAGVLVARLCYGE